MAVPGQTEHTAWLLLPPAEVVLSAAIAPTPDIPLASLRDVVVPIHDAAGELTDWTLAPGEIQRHGLAHDYASWRQTWRRTWQVGPITNLVSLRGYVRELDADLVVDLDDVLARTLAAHDVGVWVPLDQLVRLRGELAITRLALSVDDRTGVGIIDDMADAGRRAGLARTWATPTTEVILAATPETAVMVRPKDDLVVLHGGPEFASFDHVVSVDMRNDPVIIRDAAGQSFTLAAELARPLAWLVPQSLYWHVRAIPIAAVWASWFAAWDEAIGVARDLEIGLTVSSRSSFE